MPGQTKEEPGQESSCVTKEISRVERYDQIAKVADLYLKGTTNPTYIAKSLGIKRAEALDLIDEWKGIARNSVDIKEQAKDVLQAVLQHYDKLVERSWETIEQADDNGDLRTKATLIKNTADIEAKRVDMLQKAGLYDDAAIGDQIAEMEEKQAILIGILKEVTGKCNHCKIEVQRRLERVTGKADPVVVTVVEHES